jgi:hypothetical protein
MAWVKWNSIENFNTWHDGIKADLGLPKLSLDQEGNEISDSVINENYTMPIVVADNDIRAFVDETYSDGLQESINPHVSNYEAHSL